MKRIKMFLLLSMVVMMALGSTTYAIAVGEPAPGKSHQRIETKKIVVTGVVTVSKIDARIFEVDGYKLVGNFNFKKFLGKLVEVKGVTITSPNIYMIKAIKVESIKLLKTTPDPANQVNLIGVVKFNNLETGFYEVEGYRLVGKMDFKKFLGKMVNVTGILDDSVSQFMTKAIKVESIKEIKFIPLN